MRGLGSRTTAFMAMGLLGLAAVTVVGGSTSVGPESPSAARPTPQSTTERTSQPSPWPSTRTTSQRPFRAFSADSWWNTPLPYHPPQNPATDEILDYLSTATESRGGCLTLAGAGQSPWGHPIYWTESDDPTYYLRGVNHTRMPELNDLRIPRDAQPASNNDGTMSIFDLDKDYVVALTNAEYDADDDEWSATGATVTYLESNGLHAATGRSDDNRNLGGHRGNNGATMAVRWDMVRAGAINHVLKIASGPEVADRAVFPMVGSDGDYQGSDPAVPPQGLRLRIEPSLDLDRFNLHPQALVIARALQRYGAYIGDSGGVTALKLENTAAEGRGQLWDLASTDLCALPLDPKYWDVIAEGYDPGDDQ